MEGDQSQPRKINILLLGESGAGKSTFINSLANYLEYDSLNEAMHSDIKWKVPARFTVTDENYEEISMSIGNPDMENYSGHIVTKGVSDYEFRHKNVAMHLIDTPPLGDGKSDDNEKNMNKILSFISKLNHINAIAFFLKPNVSILSEYFKGCLNTLLLRLNTSVFKNIVFVFTHTRSTFYKPGETLTILTKVLKEMSVDAKATIPCSKENMFCLDNETFRYLVAYKRGVMSDDENMKVFSQSWKLSTDCCQKFINYVIGDSKTKGLEPFVMQTIRSPKTILATVEELFDILADISLNLHENMQILSSREVLCGNKDISLLNLEKGPQNKMIGCFNCMKTQKILRNGNATFSTFTCFQTEFDYDCNKSSYIYFSNICGKCKCKLTSHKEFFYRKNIYLESISKDKDRQIEITKLFSKFELEMEALLGFLAQCQLFRRSASAVHSDFYKDFLQSQIIRNKTKKEEYETLKKKYGKFLLGKPKVLSSDIENKLKTLYDLKYTGQILRNIYKKFLPQNEVFKKQQSVKSPIVEERKLIVHFNPDDDTRKHNLDPETELENFKRNKLSPESNTEKLSDSDKNKVAELVKSYEKKDSRNDSDTFTYSKSNKHNSDVAGASFLNTPSGNIQADKDKNQHKVFDNKDKNQQKVYDDSKYKTRSSVTAEVATCNKGNTNNSDAAFSSKANATPSYGVKEDKDENQHKISDDVSTNKTKSNVATKASTSNKGNTYNSVEAALSTYFPQHFRKDKDENQHKVDDDVPINDSKNTAADVITCSKCFESTQATYFGNFSPPSITRQYNFQTDDQHKICGDVPTSKTNKNTAGDQEKSYDSSENVKLEDIIDDNKERYRVREHLMRKCKNVASYSEECQDNICNSIDKCIQQNKSSISEANTNRKDSIVPDNCNYDKQGNKTYNITSNYFGVHNKSGPSSDWDEDFLDLPNSCKAYPTDKDNYNFEQDCCPSMAMKQQAIDNEKHLDNFKVSSNVEERKLTDRDILKMHEEYLANAQRQKELFEKLSNKIDAMEISMNKMGMAFAQAEDKKLNKFSQKEQQVESNAVANFPVNSDPSAN